MLNIAGIPDEMKFYRQWVVWRMEDHGGAKPTKVPYCPQWGTRAAVDNPGTWGSFEDAAQRGPFLEREIVVKATGFDAEGRRIFPSPSETGVHGIGFVLTKDDPYAFIDLDDTKGNADQLARQQRIFTEFQSYSERSPSGSGLHVIVKGSVDRGRKRDNIEVYSSLRYMTMTGDVYRDTPITEQQELLTLLWSQMGGAAQIHQYGQNAEQKEEDAVIVGKALSALNGDKFARLMNGDIDTDHGGDHSAADQAFVDIVAFYTQNREQIERIWMGCALGAREKTQKRKDYRTWTINLAFDRQLPPVDVDGLRVALDNMIAEANNPEMQFALPGFVNINGEAVYAEAGNGAAEGSNAAPTLEALPGRSAAQARHDVTGAESAVNAPSTIILPPGLVGEVAQFIYEAAPRPVVEIALAGAIGFCSGIVGRAFNISGTGLNLYTLLLAPTGTGKEAISHGISKLVTTVRATVPTIGDFVGPGEIRSDAALIKWLSRNACIYSIVGEFGMRLKQMSAPNANSNEIGVRRVLMDLFNKSGHGNILNPMAYSDKDKNTPAVNSPSLSIIGETTPERFYEAIDEAMIADGLLPRFLTIEYRGRRPELNEHSAHAVPSYALIDMCQAITVHCLEVMAKGSVVNVALDPGADRIMRDFNRYCDNMINGPNAREVTRMMWNRAHIKALKLAAVVGVGMQPYHATIDAAVAQWSTDLIVRDVMNIIDRFEAGTIGGGAFGVNEIAQIRDMKRVVRDFLASDVTLAVKYGIPQTMHSMGIVTGNALNKRLSAMASFRTDRIGPTNAIKRAIQNLLDADELREIPKTQMNQMFGTTAKAYAISRPEAFF